MAVNATTRLGLAGSGGESWPSLSSRIWPQNLAPKSGPRTLPNNLDPEHCPTILTQNIHAAAAGIKDMVGRPHWLGSLDILNTISFVAAGGSDGS
jgi:hypothetical protein